MWGNQKDSLMKKGMFLNMDENERPERFGGIQQNEKECARSEEKRKYRINLKYRILKRIRNIWKGVNEAKKEDKLQRNKYIMYTGKIF